MIPQARKSEQLGLSFPYDWSNPDISDDALILNVLKRGLYADICRVCAYFGFNAVDRLASELGEPDVTKRSLTRMLKNIKIGFANAQTR